MQNRCLAGRGGFNPALSRRMLCLMFARDNIWRAALLL